MHNVASNSPAQLYSGGFFLLKEDDACQSFTNSRPIDDPVKVAMLVV
jgi:hypothetical protein